MSIENILGSVAFVDLGDYSASTTYKYLNFVRQNNHWYFCRLRTGVLNIAPPATFTDNTQWRALVESGDNSVLTITKDPDTGVVTIERKGLGDITIDEGHVISKNSETALGQRKNLKITASTDIVVDNPDASTTEIDFTALETLIGLNTAKNSYPSGDETKVGNISVSSAVNLNTMDDEINVILNALGQSDVGILTEVLNIPTPTRAITTDNFCNGVTTDMVINPTTGVITNGTPWTYQVGGELYQTPPLAYHKQTASVDGDAYLYITIGVACSKARHAALITVLEDFINYAPNSGTANTPNPTDTYLENYVPSRFTPSPEHSEGSTDGIKVIAQTAPDGGYSKLFTITFAVLAAVKDHYDSESKFFIQNDRGIRGFVYHTGTDTIITAQIKAEIAAIKVQADANKDVLNDYPSISSIQNASDGQIMTVSETNVAGTKASMTFEIYQKNSNGSESMLLQVVYPTGSPLKDVTLAIPITIIEADTTTTICEKIVTSFEGSVNADIVDFRDGYEGSDGFTYGGYLMESLGQIVTITSDNDGKVYNAVVGVYEAVERIDNRNATNLAHGTGGPNKEFVISNVPGTTFVGDTAAITSLRPGTGWVTGTRFIPTAAGTTIITAAAIAAQATIEYPAAPVNNSLLGLTGMFNGANNSFFQIRTASDPAVQPTTVFFGNFAAQAGDAFLRQNNGTQLLFLNQADGTNSGTDWATNTLAIMDTMIAAGDTGIQAAGFNTTVTGAFISANCSVARTDRTLVFTANTAGDTGGADLSEASDSANNYTTTFVQGADETTTTLTQGVEYIVQTPTTLLNLFTQATITIF